MPLSQIQTTNNQVVPNLGRRNILINGAFQHWQRGTSFSSNVYGSDRWKLYAPGSHAYSRSTDTPDFGLASQPNGFQFSASIGGSGDATGLTQFIESSNSKHIPTSSTTKVILSFYLKHTTNSGTAKITSSIGTLDSADASGASTTRSTQNHNTTTGWVRYTHETTGATLTSAAGNGLQVTIKHNGSGTTAFLLTGCQLEISESVTPFEHRSVGEELALCKRYYQRVSADASYDYGAITVAIATSSAWYCPFVFDGLMRVDPTLSYSAVANFRVTLQHSNSTQASAITIAYPHNNRLMLGVQAGSNNDTNGARLFGFNGASAGWIAFSAEL